MHADSKSLGEASTRQAEEERLRLQREWLDAKAALAKERERAAEASRDAELHAAALQQKVHDALADGASAREEKAQLQSQADTLRQLQEAQQLQLRDAIAKLAAAPASGGGGALASSPGGSTDNVAEELARAKRELQVAQEAVAAEKHELAVAKLSASLDQTLAQERERSADLQHAHEKQRAEAMKKFERDLANQRRTLEEALEREKNRYAELSERHQQHTSALLAKQEALVDAHHDKSTVLQTLGDARNDERRTVGGWLREKRNASWID